MKCLTICNPYPVLILTAQDELPPGYFHKRVENRKQMFGHRGPLLIHAGKSTEWMTPADEQALPQMVFGCLVGVVELMGCYRAMTKTPSGLFMFSREPLERFPWLQKHKHTEGPYCLILANARRFQEPITYRGQQGIFDVEDGLVQNAIKGAINVDPGTV